MKTKTLFRGVGVHALCACFALTGCAGTASGPGVGPALSSMFDPKGPAAVDPAKHRLDVVVPVFDPGLSDRAPSAEPATDYDEFDPGFSDEAPNHEDEAVWPELRRAEANRFAHNLKVALDDAGAFASVRVAPDRTATGDLYLLGRILESDGEDVAIEIRAVDVSGREWFARTFSHAVESDFHKDPRNDGRDPYDPVFEAAANRVAHELDDRSSEELEALTALAELRFGANFAEDAFAEHLRSENGRIELASLPADDDPMLRRVRAVRVRDQLFLDGLQENYHEFSESMRESYLTWQESSLIEKDARREVNRKAAGEAILGVLFIGLGALAASAGHSNSRGYNPSAVGVGAGAALAGTQMIVQSFQTAEGARVHREQLEELGRSIDLEMSPRVMAFDKETVELSGNAKEQFAQWRTFLQRIFEEERTPETRL